MITIYGTSGCGFCTMAVKKCKDLGLEHEYRDIGYSKWYKEYRQYKIDRLDVPYILINQKPIGNYQSFIEYLTHIRELGDFVAEGTGDLL